MDTADKCPTICVLPWMSASARNNGDLRVCCQANVSVGGGILRKSDGESYNWSKDKLADARNSATLKEVRLSMLEGKWHQACERCRSEEAAGVVSRRVRTNELYDDEFNTERARAGTRPDGGIDPEAFPVLDLDVRFGNLCNLRCRMCGPTDSSSWYADYLKIHGRFFNSSNGRIEIISENGSLKAPAAGFEWYENSHVSAELERIAPSVRQIYVVGGEPFLIQGHWDYLRRLVQLGRAGDVNLEYNTNLTRIPDDAWELWSHFKAVYFGVSLEGVGAVNDYIRYPSRFSMIEKNLERVDAAKNVRVWIAATVSIYNVLHLPDLMLWKLSKGFKRVNADSEKPFVTSHLLHKPEFLNIKALPPWAKEIVARRYQEFPARLESELDRLGIMGSERDNLHRRAEKLLGSYLKFMFSDDMSRWLPEFASYTRKLDDVREQSFSELVPEFADLLQTSTSRS